MQTSRSWHRLCNCQIYIRAEVHCLRTLRPHLRSCTVCNPLQIHVPTIGMVLGDRGPDGGWQEDDNSGMSVMQLTVTIVTLRIL